MKRIITIAVVVSILGFAGCASDSEQTRKPGSISVIDTLIEQEIAAGHIPGAVVRIQKGDSVLHRRAYGYAHKYNFNREPIEQPDSMTTDHLFDLASLTKVCATTLGIMQLVDKGIVGLEDPISNYLPAFESGAKSEITIRHLLTHTAGFYQWKPTYYHASNRNERYKYIAELPLKWKVGEDRHYSDLGFMLLGDIIKRVTDQRLDRYLRDQIYKPLNMQHTVFNPMRYGFDKIAATSHGNPFEKQMVYDDDFGYEVDVDPGSWNNWREYTLRGEVNDGNAWYANGGIAGHAGLFSTVDDLQVLVNLLLDKGKFKGEPLI
jgi:CubicO group peptidase (beta-lactamase class C family)